MRLIVGAAIAVAACASPRTGAVLGNRQAPSAATDQPGRSVTIAPFGVITIDDGAMIIIDRYSSADGSIQRLTIARDLRATKSYWQLDGDGRPVGLEVRPLELVGDERTEIASWFDELWQLAPNGWQSYPREYGAQAYTWAIVLRRGDKIRVLERGASGESADLITTVLDTKQMHF